MIFIEHLTKDYGNSKGVFDLSFSIRQGEVFGYLGPNGAGKTTTIRHLLGFLNADKGNCSINGLNCRTQSSLIMKSLGYLPGEMAFFDGMTGIRFLKFMADLHRLKEITYCHQLIEMFELDVSVKIKKMSKGMKQKLGIVSAFMHNPDVLVLDEPTAGLDPLMQRMFLDLIQTEKMKGKTILMSSHNFDEVEKACNRIGIIKQGRLVAIEDVDVLRNSKRKNFDVTFESAEHARNFAEKIKCKNVTLKDNVAIISLSGDINNFIKELSAFPIVDLKSENGSLEDLFMHYYGGK